MGKRLPRKLAAILYADVAGYSKLTAEDEEGTHRRLSESLDLLSDTIKRHGGRVVHYAGDAVLADFPVVSEALASAIAAQGLLEDKNADLSETRRVSFRIGVNLGEVIIDRDDIYGTGVNVAARLESLAEPGGICVSGSVHDAVGSELPIEYDFMGEQQVKNIAKPVRAYRVIIHPNRATVPAPSATRPVSRVGRQSVAVLPFENLTGGDRDDYFVDGLVDDITTELSRSANLSVISRNSTFVYKGKATDTREVGRALGVRYLLEGSVRKSRSRIRVNVQIIDAKDGSHVWAERLDRELTDVFAVQDEIVERVIGIVGGTGGKLDEIARSRAMRKDPSTLEAYDCFLRGREILNRYRVRDPEFPTAREMFEKAIERDPNFSRPYLGLAWYHYILRKWGLVDDPDKTLKRATELVRTATRLDAPDYWSHWIAGTLALCRHEFGEARSHFNRALDQNPNDTQLLAQLTDSLSYLGQADQAIELGKRAMRLNPNYPDWYPWTLAFAYFTAGQYEEAAKLLEIQQDNPESRRLLSATYAKLGRLESAKAAAQVFLDYNPSFSIQRWAENEPYEDSKLLNDYVDGLRKAGLPE